ncbi:receptor-interacting serine/threonine-protein kinase 4-like [Watersipora subatra]|uniref:receptor-interacting serine/threonine-protein kinase 4-like n=1 Tax=Watersipora subatra TaxID=2589382 RepID=UPI00355B6B7F
MYKSPNWCLNVPDRVIIPTNKGIQVPHVCCSLAHSLRQRAVGRRTLIAYPPFNRNSRTQLRGQTSLKGTKDRKMAHSLWEERAEGKGDTEIQVNGETTTAHRGLLKAVPYFRELMSYQTTTPGDSCRLKIEDNSVSLTSVLKSLWYVYSNFCFTSNCNHTEFLTFCQLVERQTLAIISFNSAMQSMTRFTCVDCFILGQTYQLAPLRQKAWRLAIENQWIDQVKQILAWRPDLDMRLTSQCQTALHICLERGYTGLTKVLIQAGANINIFDNKGMSPLSLSVWKGQRQICKELLQSGANVNSTDQWGQTALHKAAARGNEELVKLLLESNADANMTCRTGYTPLHMAAIHGYDQIVTLLLTHGVVWTIESSNWHTTALHMAATKGNRRLVQTLLELDNTTNRNKTERECLTPLHTAIIYGYNDIVEILLENGADANAIDWEGRTPTHYAAKSGNTIALELLIKAGAKLYKQDKHMMTCLHVAATANHSNSVSLILKQLNNPINVVDKHGLAALHYAAENRNTGMVRQLLKAGAVPTILSHDGKVAKNLRGKKKQLDILRFLIKVRLQRRDTQFSLMFRGKRITIDKCSLKV